MAYNSYYPQNYNYNYNQPMYQPMNTQPTQPVQNVQTLQDDRIWVASEAAAEAYPIQPNGFLRLWDGNQPYYYEKRADASGRPLPLLAYEYKLREAPTAKQNAKVSNDFEERITALEEKIAKMERVKKEDRQDNRQDNRQDRQERRGNDR